MASATIATCASKFVQRSPAGFVIKCSPAVKTTVRTCSSVTPTPASSVFLATSEAIPGKTIKAYKGMAIGSTVRTRDVTKDITSAVKAVFGGELQHYTQLMSETREEAIIRLQEHAASLGANGVVSLRMTTSNIAQSASEVMAYGTAVVVE
eukprot:TRINITY_DN71563_c0_g1_i1.p1 TRINITY_DN71563_c0_g1~~TRINITY_DN71563_c0_g1_i1.p1  ORF type:complete len:174 (-),score=18.22 TRINITY_DN71563_c0_g1_i1:52-504(-)